MVYSSDRGATSSKDVPSRGAVCSGCQSVIADIVEYLRCSLAGVDLAQRLGVSRWQHTGIDLTQQHSGVYAPVGVAVQRGLKRGDEVGGSHFCHHGAHPLLLGHVVVFSTFRMPSTSSMLGSGPSSSWSAWASCTLRGLPGRR